MAIFPCAVHYILVAYLFYTRLLVPPSSLFIPVFPLPPSPSPLVTTSLFSVSLFLFFVIFTNLSYFFQIPHPSNIIQYLSFSIWLISLSLIYPTNGLRSWWAAVHGVTQSRTQLKRLGSSSNTLQVYPSCCKWQNFIFKTMAEKCSIIYVPHLFCPFICWWTLRLFRYFGNCE